MPKLRKVVLTNHWCPLRRSPLSRFYPKFARKPYGEGWVRPELEHRRGDHGFSTMYHALSASGRRVDTFSVYHKQFEDNPYPPAPLRPRSFLAGPAIVRCFTSPHQLRLACNVFQHMRKLDLTLDYHDQDAPFNDSMSRLLAAATGLEHLRLAEDASFYGYFTEFLGTTCWPSLRSLKLTGVVAFQDHLIEFLARHCSSLEALDIRLCALQDTGWEETTDRLLCLRWPKLRAVRLETLCKWDLEEGDMYPEATAEDPDVVTRLEELWSLGRPGWDQQHLKDVFEECKC